MALHTHKTVMVALTVSFLVIQVFVMIGLAGKGYPGFMRATAMTTGLMVLYTVAEYKWKLYMNNYIRAAVLIALIADSAGGQYLEYYITSTVFDKILHAFGAYALSMFCYILMSQLLTHQVGKAFTFFWVLALGISIGALYEIMEFTMDTLTKPTLPGQPSLYDTDMDLISDSIGAAVAACQAAFSRIGRGIENYRIR